VVFLSKPGRMDYTRPKAYRSISLSFFSLKTMERLCERYIRGEVLSNHPLQPNQHAYIPGRSTDTALVVGRVERSMDNKGVLLISKGLLTKQPSIK